LAYDGERSDAPVLDQLEAILRHVVEELAAWRTRALKAEGEAKDHPGQGRGAARHDADARSRATELEQENKQLKQRVEAARSRVGDLLSRLAFLEEQAGGNGAGRSASRVSGAGGEQSGSGAL
jgi:FtsZ-binding cell division protein ZapB